MRAAWPLAALTILAAALPSLAWAGPSAKAVELTSRLGLSILEKAGTEGTLVLPDPTGPPAAEDPAVEAALGRYVRLQNDYTSAKAGGEMFETLADGVVGGSLAAGSIPGVLIGAALKGGIRAGNARLDAFAKAESRKYLLAYGIALGADRFAALAADPPALIQSLVASQDLLRDVKARAVATGDTALVAATAASLAEAADATAVAAVRTAEANRAQLQQTGQAVAGAAAELKRIDGAFSGFVIRTEDAFASVRQRLAAQGATIDRIGDQVASLGTAVARMDDKVERLGRNQDLVADFVFSRMTAAERVKALKAGLLDGRILCPEAAPDCDPAEVKQAMIDRYTADANLQDSLSAANGALEASGTVLKIAGDLGVDLPPAFAKAYSLGSGAVTAISSFAAGNYLGAVSAITGLFGGSVDHAAAREQRMMTFLQANFDHINAQLQRLQQGQAQILGGLVKVSQQIDAMHRDLSAHLFAIDRKLDGIDGKLTNLLWQDWLPCQTVYHDALYPVRGPAGGQTAGIVDRGSMRFPDLAARLAVIDADGPQVESCRLKLKDAGAALDSATAWRKFGSLIDLARGQAPEGRVGQENALDAMQRFVDQVVTPSGAILTAWAARERIDRATLLYLLAAAPGTGEDLDRLLALLGPDPGQGGSGWRFDCQAGADPRRALIGGAICRTADPEALASLHLAAALDTQSLVTLADWALVVSQLADLRGAGAQGYVYARSLDAVGAMSGPRYGADLIEALAPLGNIGLAYVQRLNGGLIARVMAEDILAGRADASYATLLDANVTLARNVAMELLWQWRAARPNAAHSGAIPFEARYLQAVRAARRPGAQAMLPLTVLFGGDHGFSLGDPAQGELAVASFTVQLGTETLRLPMPGPSELAERRFAAPPEYPALAAARDRLVERLLDYRMGEDGELVQSLVAMR